MTVLQLDETDDSSDCESCYTVKTTHGKQWFTKVNMVIDDATRQDVICQLDSGSTCNILGFRQYCILTQNGCPPLKSTSKALRLYGGTSKLEPLGTVDITCSVQSNTECLNFYVVDTDQTALLSAEACEKLGLLTVNIVNSVDTSAEKNFEPLTRSQLLTTYMYHDVFEGLGSFSGEYKIEIDPTVKPVQHQPRKVHQAMKQEIHTKLKDLENRGVIKKVTTPTDWISSMLTVKKPGKLRICIDPRDLNKAIKRPHYIMPTLEDILPNLANAKVFSVLDAKEGFWHIKLDESSSFLTTFWTPFGRYRWLRLPFGISSAPEEFQRRQHEVLEGLSGAECVMDDIIVYGRGQTMESAIRDNDRNLTAVLQRAREVGLKLNKDKFKLRQTEVKYMGSILTAVGIRPDPDKPAPEYHGQHTSKLAEEIAHIQQAEWVRKVTDSRLNQIRDLTNKDETLQSLKTVILSGWPDTKEDVPIPIRPYWNVRDSLTVQDGIIYHSSRVVIPKALRPELLRRTHSSHVGIEACLRRARDSLYWPLMNEEIKDFVSKCSKCSMFQRKQQKEPLMTHDVPDQPWSKLGIDIFTLKTEDYLVTVDFYSDFFELDLLPDTTAATVINCLKQHFARHGTPDVVITDNGLQFKSTDFHDFSCNWEFQHVTSSPYYSQSNGKAEATVKIAKNMVRKAKKNGDDLWKCVLDWRNTPTVDMASSPSQ
ncbi:uncharacterized protein K02A2.6-like [Saccostrea cucullata]|uniref:uncharacterized protein K02A2.6-like n=1 Tax=Saccostrea cuccullata TaxID=36930 RepID=UPI002ED2EAC4